MADPTAGAPLLEVRQITKHFPGVIALQNVDLTVGRGEVLAVIGENGAGKSTLMKILAGVQEPGLGRILLDGEPVQIDSVGTAERLGIALIHQELNLADNLDVGANVFLGREPRSCGFIRFKQIEARTRGLLQQVQLDCSPRERVRNLPLGKQQRVEIAKALSVNARILIMDEPTSSLSQTETENLFHVIKDLRARGVTIIYISHRLGEVKELADRVTVLRDGRNAGHLNRGEISREAMVRMMVGRDISQFYVRDSHRAEEVVLELAGIRTQAHPNAPINLEVRAGELVGLAGLVGAGRTELLQVIFGVDRPLGGTLRINGVPRTFLSPRDAIEAGIALVPEDRKTQGLLLEMAVKENISLASLRRDQKRGFLNRPREQEIVTGMIDKLQVKTPSQRQIAQYLSGGNQQKLVLGKWLALEPKLLLLDEPTRGIDVGAKQEIYRLMVDLAKQGVAILFVSSEMEEVLNMSDRTLVMHQGKITGQLQRHELTEEAVMHLATGGLDGAAA